MKKATAVLQKVFKVLSFILLDKIKMIFGIALIIEKDLAIINNIKTQ